MHLRMRNNDNENSVHTYILPISLPFEHCVLRELMRTSLLIRDGLRKENAANLHRQTAIH